MKKKEPINKNFISPLDLALNDFNNTHSLSRSQQEEANKYQRLHALRDKTTKLPIPSSAKEDLWENF